MFVANLEAKELKLNYLSVLSILCAHYANSSSSFYTEDKTTIETPPK